MNTHTLSHFLMCFLPLIFPSILSVGFHTNAHLPHTLFNQLKTCFSCPYKLLCLRKNLQAGLLLQMFLRVQCHVFHQEHEITTFRTSHWEDFFFHLCTSMCWFSMSHYLSSHLSPSSFITFRSHFLLLSLVIAGLSLNILYLSRLPVHENDSTVFMAHTHVTLFQQWVLSPGLVWSVSSLRNYCINACGHFIHTQQHFPILKLRLTNRTTNDSFRNNVEGISDTAVTSQTAKRESRNSRRHSINKDNSTMQYEKLQEVI